MIRISELLYIFLLSLLLLMSLAFSEDESFIYHGFNKKNLNLSGIANIHPNGLLELTNIRDFQFGRAFFPVPFKFSKTNSFSTNFVFAIDPQTTDQDEQPPYGGHGFVFVISPSMEFPGALPTQYFGIFNMTSNGMFSNHIVAVEFDTIRTVEFGDINDNHIGIDVNSLTSISSVPAAYFSDNDNKNFTLISRKSMHAWIDYDAESRIMNVAVATPASSKPEKPLLSSKIDLSSVFLESMYVGFSSSTGSMASHHYILGWSFNHSGPSQNLNFSQLPSLPPISERHGSRKHILVVVVSLVAAGCLVLIAVLGTLFVFKRRKSKEVKQENSEELREYWEKDHGPRRFRYEEIYKATKGFKEDQVLGSGGFGTVYRGVLPSCNTQVAVKRYSQGSEQGMQEFITEISSMGKLKHRSLVQLLGYCRADRELLLVYDYMHNGSLDKFLFQDDTINLNWVRRSRILKAISSALFYLHEQCEQIIIHRDIKASNVMIDSELNARIGDFGLATFRDHGSIAPQTRVVGTVGYLAPEVSARGMVSTKSDVYAFGILMLEVACGRRTIDAERPKGEVALAEWVFQCWYSGDIIATADPRLQGKFLVNEMELVLKLGLLCVQPTPEARPTMGQVFQFLDRKAPLPDLHLDNPRTGFAIVNEEADDKVRVSSPNPYYELFISTTSVLSHGR